MARRRHIVNCTLKGFKGFSVTSTVRGCHAQSLGFKSSDDAEENRNYKNKRNQMLVSSNESCYGSRRPSLEKCHRKITGRGVRCPIRRKKSS